MADTMMLMKQRVLDMAVRGELVEQREEEGTAEELLSEIKEEKERLIKEKKIKREKPLPEIERENIPFNIPKNWKWVRLGQVGDWGAGATPERGNLSYWKDGTIPWIKTGELNNSHVKLSEEFITEKAVKENSVRLNKPGDILIAMYGATIGKLGILDIEATTNQACCACTTFEKMNSMYLFYFLMSNKQNFKNSSEGGAQPNISRTKIVRELIPLPPLAEQERIVSKIEYLFTIIEQISEKKEDSLNLIINIRKTALQEAVMGKLVEQDEEDEPASELLRIIRLEKEKMEKTKKISNFKKLPEIDINELPYILPYNWEWVRLGNLIQLISGRDLKTSEYNDYNLGIPYYTGASNFVKGDIIINRWTNVPKVITRKGDLLITVKGTIGDMSIQKEEEAHIARQIMGIRNLYNLELGYIKYFLESQIRILKGKAKSMIPGLSRDDILHYKFPLPPLAEQKRIVEKLDKIMGICDQMEEILDGSREETPVG